MRQHKTRHRRIEEILGEWQARCLPQNERKGALLTQSSQHLNRGINADSNTRHADMSRGLNESRARAGSYIKYAIAGRYIQRSDQISCWRGELKWNGESFVGRDQR